MTLDTGYRSQTMIMDRTQEFASLLHYDDHESHMSVKSFNSSENSNIERAKHPMKFERSKILLEFCVQW